MLRKKASGSQQFLDPGRRAKRERAGHAASFYTPGEKYGVGLGLG
jgi:hypothetical protein